MTTIIQNDLQELLVRSMRPMSKSVAERVFDNTGSPLNTLSGCILVAYAFKVIDEDVFRKLDCVRKIRNVFAHTTADISLDNEEIQPLLVELGCEAEVGKRIDWYLQMMLDLSNTMKVENKLP